MDTQSIADGITSNLSRVFEFRCSSEGQRKN